MFGRAQAATQERLWTQVGLVVGAAAITAVCAQVSFGYPVPTTLQTFAALGAGALLGARRGAASQVLYLGAGAAGMPVFATGHAGISWLTQADPLHVSGGYLWGLPVAALLAGLICDRFGRSFYVSVPAMLVGSVALYAIGLLWLHQALPTPWSGAGASTLHYGLWPFVLGDLAKIFAAAAIIDPSAPWARFTRTRRDVG
ncbi:MAG TPA: biotin transporter BioY [Gaiellales bacterium]|jgi:biotin transport system substrate-specific component